MTRQGIRASCITLAVLTTPAAFAQGICSYNNASTSFGASYTSNAESTQVPLACTSNITAARLADTSYGRSVITAPNTGDFKFLVKNASATVTPPTFTMLSSLSPETKQFPDSGIVAPTGGGCNDSATSPGIAAIERHLHRSWPLFGTTYYYGDYIANPPNDPATVTSVTSPYTKWAPYNSTDEYLYLDPDNQGPNSPPAGSLSHGWGPQPSGTTADQMHPLVAPGYADGCAARGLTGTDYSTCRSCMATKGYYLKDSGASADLKNSVFRGAILNDFPPAWVHLAWAYGFLADFQLHDSANNPLFKLVRNPYRSNNASNCPSQPNITHSGPVSNFAPVGLSNCSIAYPTYNWPQVQSLGMGPVQNDLLTLEGGNGDSWASGVAQSTPAGDLLALSAPLLDFATKQCPSCQTKAVLYIGFGQPCGEAYPSGLPAQTLAPCTGECRYVNPAAACTCAGVGNWIPDVAHYLYNSLNVRTYFIGMGGHTASMKRAAVEGQGKYFDARNVTTFHDALLATLQDVIQLGTSTATSTVNAVQVNVAGQEELVPRFVARQAGNWEGHLNKYFLFSEFAANCAKAGDTAPIPNPQQPVCTATCVCAGGSCTGRWLVDSQCKLISPDSTGFLFQSVWNGSALVPSAAAAVPVWDANDLLRQVNWYQRKVYTAIDTNGDTRIDTADGDGLSPAGMYSLTLGATPGNSDLSGGVSDAVADALAPYMALDGTTMCSDIEAALGMTLPGLPSQRLRACARVILNATLGEDLLNENALDFTSLDYLVTNRISMLGDVFHSSPQDIGPPASEADCGAATRRCVTTLFNGKPANGLPNYQPLEKPALVVDPPSGTSVANPGGTDAYQAYYLNETFGRRRPHVTMFGANDGLVHAIQTGCYVSAQALPTGGFAPVYWEGPGNAPCVAGSAKNGSELWAFIPPDLLPKLGYLLLGKHQFFVDNSPMVRDIYAPGAINGTKRYTTSSPATMDFKRIAVLGEREGGTHWFGLDVTDPANPQFRWIFPQPNTEDELKVGFSWGDWVPNAPPIVPIRLAVPTGSTGFPTYTDSSGIAQSFQEKWVVLLPGGYDPYGIVGKSIYMLDAYTGAKIFQTKDTASVKQDFPFAALPAAVPWGTSASSPSPPGFNNGFFDTAVVGDLGGQVWTLRFNDVGQGFPAGLVSNWNFGRAFRQFSADDAGAAAGEYRMQHRTPFFHMAAIARMPEGPMRAFIGSGDRANMAESGVGDCSVYNPLACGKRQCVTTLATNAGINSNPSVSGVGSFKGDLAATWTSSTSASFTPASAACSPASTALNACVTCAGGGSSATTAPAGQPQYACTNTSTGWQCAVKPISAVSSASRLETASGAIVPDPNTDIGYFSRLLAFNVFDATRAIFTTPVAATAYDGSALTESSLLNLFASSATKTFDPVVAPTLAPQTSGTSNGFYFHYPVLDERTATNSVLLQNCLTWYSMQPGVECKVNADCGTGTCNTTTHTCTAPSACGGSSSAIPARSAFLYQINATDGSTNCGLTSSSSLRTAAPTNSFLVPPPPAQALISVNAKNQFQYSIIAPAGQLSLPASTSIGGAAPFSFFYTVESPRELHECRHNMNANACY